MKEQLITFETAELANKKGFDWIISDDKFYDYSGQLDFTFQGYREGVTENGRTPAPTQSLLQKWLYEKHTIWVQSNPEFNANEMMGINVSISSWRFPFISVKYGGYDVYEGLEIGLQEALKLL